tara:strand:+ start:2712 stop:3071 length:360 start_codon:yes stop_codon:yes gene_type:complete
MCWLFTRNKKKKDPFSVYNNEYRELLSKLSSLLKQNKNNGQMEFINKLKLHIENDRFNNFGRDINALDMWGGAGAVWEVYIEDYQLRKEFEITILKLINLMKKSQKLKRRVRYIEKNLK